MKNIYKEIRTLSASNLRALCIRKDWYTRGSNDEYEHLLLDLAERKKNLTTDDIILIAEDITAHSNISDDYDIECIAWEVNRSCNVSFQRQ